MPTTEQNAAMQSKLTELGLPHESINVFGAVRCNVHVTCLSRTAATKWVLALSKVFAGAQVQTVATMWDAVENKGTNLLPTKRSGFRVSVAA